MRGTLLAVARRTPQLLHLGVRIFVRLLLLALPFAAGAGLLWATTLRGHDINYYLAETPPEWRRALAVAAVLGVAYALLALRQLARWLYALPLLMFDGAQPSDALSGSERMLSGKLRKIVPPLVAWWVGLGAVALACAWAGRFVTEPALRWAGIDVHRVLPLVALFMAVAMAAGFVFSTLQAAGHQFFVTRAFAEQRSDSWLQVQGADSPADVAAWRRARPLLAGGVLVAILALGTAAYLFTRLDLREDVLVTAHRGAAQLAPENSLGAFRAAMEAGADYVELDVQRTRDGGIVVVHDGDLMRMAGDPRRIRDLTAAELGAIQLRRKGGTEPTGEFVPTLEQVIDLVRGRMRINVELKYNVPDPTLAPAVIDLLRSQDFLDQVVITSLDYAALRQVEGIHPDIDTGLIVTAAVGDVTRAQADFLSLNSAHATRALILQARAAGKDVHVWTVNDPEVMLRMIERDVDNVITDEPALLVRVMRDRNALAPVEQLGLRLRILFSTAPPQLTEASSVPAL
jgi:glycerophosphoryl diester phosphodiesterase